MGAKALGIHRMVSSRGELYDDFTSLRGVSAVAIGSIGFRTFFSLLSAAVEVVGAGAFMAVVVFSALAVDVGFTTVA